MRIRNLSSFVKVARLGSFRAASSLLHVSQPAISARINTLEAELGVTLFKRDKSGTALTRKGEKLLVYAEKMLAIAQQMKIVAGQQKQQGTVKIGIADTLAHLWLSPLLQQWQQLYPHISFELTSDVTPILTRQLQQHQIDLSLMVAERGLNKSLTSQTLCSYPQVWIGASGLQQNHQCWSILKMSQYPLLSFPRDTLPWHYLQQLFKSEPNEVVIHTCSSVASLINLAEQGLGIALLPEILVVQQIEAGTVQQLNTEIIAPRLEFCSSWRAEEEDALPKLLADAAALIMQHAP
ncbi:MAG: LysR family transcriptional regulator [Oceanospirillaceae bacterium]|nr:LysR family transcriptional regulator [Oceanospirillaceae bacterium]